MPTLLKELNPGYAGLILFDTLDVVETRPERPNINWHLETNEVLRYHAAVAYWQAYGISDWEDRFSEARRDHAARYGRPVVNWLVLQGQWGARN